jgi:hypothetical protein
MAKVDDRSAELVDRTREVVDRMAKLAERTPKFVDRTTVHAASCVFRKVLQEYEVVFAF